MADPRHDTDGAPPRSIHVEGGEKKKSWLPWLLALLGILALLYFISQCSRRDEPAPVAAAPAETQPAEVPSVQPTAAPATAAGLTALGAYLAGNEPTPRTFTFEQVQFATGSSEIREADASEIAAAATTLKQHPTARVRLVGYADARGDAEANARLGKARADSIKAALASNGITDDRIETASGGEDDPADTNATSEGRSENRRTELVVLQR